MLAGLAKIVAVFNLLVASLGLMACAELALGFVTFPQGLNATMVFQFLCYPATCGTLALAGILVLFGVGRPWPFILQGLAIALAFAWSHFWIKTIAGSGNFIAFMLYQFPHLLPYYAIGAAIVFVGYQPTDASDKSDNVPMKSVE